MKKVLCMCLIFAMCLSLCACKSSDYKNALALYEAGEYAQAKATFESVRDGYSPTGNDDVMDNVRMRLEKLQEMMATAN